MVTFVISLADAFRFRFAISPVREVVRLARAIANPAALFHGCNAAWLRRQRSVVKQLERAHDFRLLLSLLSARCDYYPGFLTPPPSVFVADVDTELSRIRATARERVQEEIGLCLNGNRAIEPDVQQQLRSRDSCDRISSLLAALWDGLVAPSWPRLCDLLERDILHRARSLARGGLSAVFADLASLVTREDRHLNIRQGTSGTHVLDGRGLTLTPSAFIWPYATATVDDTPALTYPARGNTSLLSETDPADAENATLANLTGSTRAHILKALKEPQRPRQPSAGWSDRPLLPNRARRGAGRRRTPAGRLGIEPGRNRVQDQRRYRPGAGDPPDMVTFIKWAARSRRRTSRRGSSIRTRLRMQGLASTT